MCGKREDGERERNGYNNTAYGARMTADLHPLINVPSDNVLAISVLIVFALADWTHSYGGAGGQKQGKGYRGGLEHFQPAVVK